MNPQFLARRSRKPRLVWRAAGLLVLSVLGLNAATFIEWPQQQDIHVPVAGLVLVDLPPETLNMARPGLEDVRLSDTAGSEVPYLIQRAKPAPPAMQVAKSFRASIEGRNTVLWIETGVDHPVTGVLLETPARQFIKAVRVEGSLDGQRWRQVADGIPIFRQSSGASGLLVEFPAGESEWAWLRLTVDDGRSDPVPFTGASVRAEARAIRPSVPVDVRIVARDESPDETRLTLALGAANLTLARLEIETGEPLFTRAVTLAAPAVSDQGVQEETLATGTILRFGGNGQPEVVQQTVAVERATPSRELVLRIHNGDSPALAIRAIRAWRRPVNLLFLAHEPGVYRMFLGNPLCAAPRYDIAALSDQLQAGRASALEAAVGQVSDHADYQPPEALPGLAMAGAPLDVSAWTCRKPIRIETAGVQTLELDLDVLSKAQRGFDDLRLMRDGTQVPFLVEHTSITRAVHPDVSTARDPRRPAVSRWSCKLPHANLPLSRLVCTSATPLFERGVRVFEEEVDSHGTRRTRELGSASWSRTPERASRLLEVPLSRPPHTDTLFLETDNGDNPPIQLGEFRLYHPVTRIVFKAAAGDAPALYYGNPKVSAPSYDLRLVGPQLLAAPKVSATAGAPEALKAVAWTEGPPLTGVRGLLFWGVLAAVVISLLIIIARLLPKARADGTTHPRE